MSKRDLKQPPCKHDLHSRKLEATYSLFVSNNLKSGFYCLEFAAIRRLKCAYTVCYAITQATRKKTIQAGEVKRMQKLKM